jgi:hypothetical protein
MERFLFRWSPDVQNLHAVPQRAWLQAKLIGGVKLITAPKTFG